MLRHQAHRPWAAKTPAGAGDAPLAALILGPAAGLGLIPANARATALSALSVTSPDTINTDIDRQNCVIFEQPAPAGTDQVTAT